jgi:hypothetical protein
MRVVPPLCAVLEAVVPGAGLRWSFLFPGGLVMVIVPSMLSTRSARPVSPVPCRGSAPPAPSSRIRAPALRGGRRRAGARTPGWIRHGRPACRIGYIVLAVLQLIALARYPHRFGWGSAGGIVYLVFLGTMLLTGAAALARGESRAATSGRVKEDYPERLRGRSRCRRLAPRPGHSVTAESRARSRRSA